MIELELGFPPSVNHYKRVGPITTTKSGKLYQKRINTAATNRFYWEVWVKVMGLKAQEGFKSFHSAMILAIEVDLHYPDHRKRDIDNNIKIIFDSLVRSQLIPDDSQIARLLVQRKDIIPDGLVKVRVYEV